MERNLDARSLDLALINGATASFKWVSPAEALDMWTGTWQGRAQDSSPRARFPSGFRLFSSSKPMNTAKATKRRKGKSRPTNDTTGTDERLSPKNFTTALMK
jgi:hypothetical protein